MEIDRTTLEQAHKHSSQHREEVITSDLCGCFYCGAIYNPSEIEEWIDQDKDNIGQTAICPKCGIDAVIGGKSGYPVNDKEFLKEMHKHWFNKTATM